MYNMTCYLIAGPMAGSQQHNMPIIKEWKIKEGVSDDFLEQFPEFSRLVKQILWERGMRDQKSIDEFFNPDWEADVHDPFLLKDMDKAVERILRALDNEEKIAVWGDYDADGVCGAAVLFSFFRDIGVNVDVYIPDRFTEGYGISSKGVDELAKNGINLVITVDCGITDNEGVDRINGHKMEVIITDHHEPSDNLPLAYAVVDHKRKDDTCPFKGFCGTGMAFKLVQALIKSRDFSLNAGWEKWLLDLVAIATVFDRVPLLGENRTLVHYGLLVLAQTKRLGVRAMFKEAKFLPEIDKEKMVTNINSETIGFLIAPRLNAMGRLKHATNSFQILVTQDEKEALNLADDMEKTNKQRQELTEGILKEATSQATLQEKDPIIFLGSPDWHAGLVGIVAGHLVEKYHKPTFIFSQGERAEEKCQGSARSIEGFNLVEALDECRHFLINGGGHKMSVGFSMYPKNIENVRQGLLNYANKNLILGDIKIETYADAELLGQEINWELMDEIEKLEPAGEGNPKPLFLIKDLEIVEARKVGNGGGHLKFKFRKFCVSGIKYFSGIGFKMGNGYAPLGENELQSGDKIDALCNLQVNDFNGMRSIELHVKDVRFAE